MIRRYQKWPIYATKRLVEIIPQLCLQGQKHTVLANILFHLLPTNSHTSSSESAHGSDWNNLFCNDYMETLNYLYNNHYKLNSVSNSTYGLIDRVKPDSGMKEIIFSPFNMKILNEVSPKIYSSQRDLLISSLEYSLLKFSKYYTNVKENIDINGLYTSVGIDFLKVIDLLNLGHKLCELSPQNVNDIFYTLFKGDEFSRITALHFLNSLLNNTNNGRKRDINEEMDISTPLVHGSVRPLDILVMICEVECKKSLELFLNIIPQNMKPQCLLFLKSVDKHTGNFSPTHSNYKLYIGLLKYEWAFNESESMLNTTNYQSIAPNDKTKPKDYTFDENLQYELVVNTVASLYNAFKSIKALVSNNSQTTEENELNDVKLPKNIISVHFEPDVVVISTKKNIFVVDLLIRDTLYRSSLYDLLNFIWACNIPKVGHQFLLNIAKLSTEFNQPFKNYNHIIDLKDNRVKRVNAYRDDMLQEITHFKRTSIKKSLRGILQEYNIPIPLKRNWNTGLRPIPVDRIKYLCIVGRGILAVEYRLRSEGWSPSSTLT
uniref:Uncharacterized protein n=1 Tax=Theileria annulata TaxID=5874 RepID=A0A3B0MR94_THEAN